MSNWREQYERQERIALRIIVGGMVLLVGSLAALVVLNAIY
jgi:tRNA G37 N-methylase TrmD